MGRNGNSSGQEFEGTTPTNEELGSGRDFVAAWISEIDAACEREKHFKAQAKEAALIYEMGKESNANAPFNILYSNTQTLLPSLYNSVPIPFVKRRFNSGDNLIDKEAASLIQRTLTYLIDHGSLEYASFFDVTQRALLNALVCGRGAVRFRYEADYEEFKEDSLEEARTYGLLNLKKETICAKYVPWNRIIYGYAYSWEEVPWVAFSELYSLEEFEENFGSELKNKYFLKNPLSSTKGNGNLSSFDTTSNKSQTSEEVRLIEIFEIWDKVQKQVIYICRDIDEDILQQIPDPYELTGFFPCPKPLQFYTKLNDLTPIPPYEYYRNQAEELNKITRRIDRLIEALKIRGIYDTTLKDEISKLVNGEENTLFPADNSMALQQGVTLEKAIYFMPIERIIPVLAQLYTQRVQVKQLIYEITGIADIMRGSTAASETLGAQEIKSHWGGLRLRPLQTEVARFIRDSLLIMAEMAITKFDPSTFKAITSASNPLEVTTEPYPDGSAASGIPVEKLLELLQNDINRGFMVDIETDSTISEETAAAKKEAAETINAIAQFFNAIGPGVQQGFIPFTAAKAILMGVVRNFKFGQEVEDALQQMQEPPKQDDGAAQKVQMEMQAHAQRQQVEQENAKIKLQLANEEAKLKLEMLQQELILKQKEVDIKVQEMNAKLEFLEKSLQLKQEALQEQVELKSESNKESNEDKGEED